MANTYKGKYMTKFKELFNESIKKMSDKNIDEFIYNNWDKTATFPYNFEASIELGKHTDVLVSADKKFMYIKDDPEMIKIAKKFKIKEISEGIRNRPLLNDLEKLLKKGDVKVIARGHGEVVVSEIDDEAAYIESGSNPYDIDIEDITKIIGLVRS
jgi:hypothetical protein